MLIWILLSEILVQATLSPSPISSSPTPISHREFCRVPLPGDSIGVVHRATGVSIGCIGLVCVRESRSSSCSSCSSCSSRSPTSSLGFRGQAARSGHTRGLRPHQEVPILGYVNERLGLVVRVLRTINQGQLPLTNYCNCCGTSVQPLQS